ncbi:MAG: sirohydrochlorin chelatase, partial [Methyloprofundus sp.]|nr:sirohydrochlorin chelatase [Methyloprofundus sp.]
MSMEYSILLVGHGSRAEQGNVEINEFANQWRAQHPEWHIDVCFIEFADVLLDAGFDLAATKAKKVLVVPLILNAAGHVKMEIPEHLAQARQRHPDVEFIYAAHIGANGAVLNIIKRSLQKVMAELDVPDPKTTGVIVLGRGSSDKIANGEVAKMARWLWEETHHELVDIAFTGITFPRLETAVQRQVQLGMTQICILPYYLFTGTLIERIAKQFERLQAQYPQVSFGLGNYFGFETEIYSILDERVLALVEDKPTQMMECDGCHYRQIAQEHGHG